MTRRVLLTCVLLLFISSPLLAHDARPLSIMIVEQQERTYRVDLRVPPSVEADNWPVISFGGAACTARSGGIRQLVDAAAETQLVGCKSPLENQRIGVRYKLF